MGLGDMSSTILVRYKGDTKQLRGEMKKLRGEEKKRHTEMLEEMEKQNAKIDDQIAMWGKVAGVVGFAVGAYKALDAGFDTYAKNTRLRAANVNTDLEGLRRATRGLVDDTTLLEFSAKAMNGTFALTQEQTEKVLKGALALRKTAGVDLPTAMERLGQAVNEGSVEPIKELGLVLDTQNNDTMQGTLDVVAAVSDEYEKLGGNVGLATDRVEKQRVDFANAMDSIKESLGKVAVALAPIVELAAQLVAYISKIEDAGNAIGGGINIEAMLNRYRAKAGLPPIGDTSAQDERVRRALALNGFSDRQREAARPQFGPFETLSQKIDRERSIAEHAKGGKVDLSGSEVDPATQEAVNRMMAAKQRELDQAMQMAIAKEATTGGGSARSFDQGAVFNAQLEMATQNALQVSRDLEIDGQNSFLSRLFGTPAEIEAQAAAMQTLAGVFDSFVGASGAAFDAWITGAKGAREAFTDFLKEALRGLAVELAMQAVRHGAFALGSLAFGNAAGAAAHGVAAAEFAAGAAAVGGAAKLMGAGGGQPATRRSPATSGLGGEGARLSAGEAAGGRTTVVMMDEAFDSLPAAQRRTQMRKRMRQSGYTFDSDVVEMR